MYHTSAGCNLDAYHYSLTYPAKRPKDDTAFWLWVYKKNKARRLGTVKQEGRPSVDYFDVS